MGSLLFLGLVGVAGTFAAMRETNRVKKVLRKSSGRLTAFPKVISAVILIIQSSEVFKMFEQFNIAQIGAVLFLLAIAAAAKSASAEAGAERSGTEGDWV